MPLNTGTTTEVVDCIGLKIQYAFGYLSFLPADASGVSREPFSQPLANYQNSYLKKFKNINPWMNIVDEEWSIEG